MAKGANWAKARTLCPPEEYGSTDWVEHYSQHPEVLTQMLGDLYRVYKSEESKRNGTANPSGGRRKAHINGNLDELWSIMTPRFAEVPFAEAFAQLKGKRSLRQFAEKAGMDYRDLSRLVRTAAGETVSQKRALTRYDLERIAKAGDVHPAYFIEWRVMVVADLVTEVFTRQPNLSISMLKGLRP